MTKRDFKKPGLALKRIRIEKKMTQKQLAEKANIHHNYLCKIESGKNTPSALVLFDLCKNLGINLSDLQKRDEF